MIKLAACGIDVGCFALRVWGDECTRLPHTRDELPEVAMRKFAHCVAASVPSASGNRANVSAALSGVKRCRSITQPSRRTIAPKRWA